MTSVKVNSGNVKYDSREDCNAIIETETNSLIAGCKSTKIPNSVTSIGEFAFYNCAGLTSVEIPNSVTSIGYDAFRGCSGLTSVVIGNSVTSIGNDAFRGCAGLTSVEIPNSVTSIGCDAFYNCAGLTSVVIGNSVTLIGDYAFSGCSGLTDVKIADRETELSLDFYDGSLLFADCPLKTVYIGGNISYPYGDSPFYGKTSLTSVVIGNSVTSIGNSAFSGCSGLKSVVIGNSVTEIGSSVFSSCSGLTSVVIGNSVTSINYNAFSGCDGIKKVVWLANTPPENYKRISASQHYVANNQYTGLNSVTVYPYLSSMFEVDGIKYVPVSPSERTCDAIDYSYSESNANIKIGNKVAYSGIEMTVNNIQPYFCYNNDRIKSLELDCDGDIAAYAFYDCNSITSITLKAKSIGTYAFAEATALTTLTLEANSIGSYTFKDCENLVNITLNDGLSSIGASAFKNCSSLNAITLPGSLGTLQSYTFSGCSSLKEITIPRKVTSIDNYVFQGCSALADVKIVDRETELSLSSNGSNPLFADCPLKTVYIGGNISYPSGSSQGYSPFYRNTSLEEVTITDKETEILDNEFYGCTNLKRIAMGDGVESIGKWAFSGCSSLESFSFGTGLKTIGQEAFSDCTAMTELHSKAATPPACGSNALDDINKWTCTLYVPGASLSQYQAADQWKEFFFMADGIQTTTDNANSAKEAARYNLGGQRLNGKQRGLNIIKYNDGTIKKVMNQ